MSDVNPVSVLRLVFDYGSWDKMVIFNLLHLLKEDRKNREENPLDPGLDQYLF